MRIIGLEIGGGGGTGLAAAASGIRKFLLSWVSVLSLLSVQTVQCAGSARC
jgi:hypothetical protein